MNPKPSLAGLLARRNFRLLWLGQSISLLGDQFYMIALPWLVLQLTGNALAMGTVLALAGVPRALFMLVGGEFTDRYSPRTILLASSLLRLGLVSLLAALVLGGAVQLWMLYALALIFGVVDAFSFPAGSSIVPRLVEGEQLPAANALSQGTAQLSMFVGPVLAGALIALLDGGKSAAGAAPDLQGIGIAFAIDALGFLVASATLWLIRLERPAEADAKPRESVLASIREGLVAVWNDRVLRAYYLLIAGINLLISGPIAIGIPVLARTRLPEGVAAFGVIMSAWGGGALLGILLAGTLKENAFERGGRQSAIIALLGFGLAGLGLSSSTPLSTAIALAMGTANGFVTIQFMTWLQRRTPAHMLGRTMSLLMFAAVGLQPISMTLAGALIGVNATTLFVVAGGLIVALVLMTLADPAIRTGASPAAEPVEPIELAA